MEPTNFRDPARWNSVPVPARVAERAYTNVDVDEETGCWISRYSVASHGYSQVGWQAGSSRHGVLGHRASWVHVNGQVPLGMTLDHVCKTKRCVNPGHLRLLPNYENARRTFGADWPMGFCKHGHPNSSLAPVMLQKRKGAEPRRVLRCSECFPESGAPRNADKTHCKRGHALVPPNIYASVGRRECVACARARSKAYTRGERLNSDEAWGIYEQIMKGQAA